MIQPASSLTERVQTLAFDAHILAAGFVGGELAVVTAEGAIQIGRETRRFTRMPMPSSSRRSRAIALSRAGMTARL